MVRIALLAALLALPRIGVCDLESAPQDAPDELHIACVKVPAAFIFPNSSHKPELPIHHRSKQNPKAVWHDVRSYFESSGVPMPDGAMAIYDLRAETLTLRNTRAGLDLIDSLFWGCGGPNPNMAVEFRTYECTIGSIPPGEAPIDHQALKRLAPEKIRLLDQISTLGRSGEKILAGNTGSASPKKGASRFCQFGPEEYGTRAEIETVAGPDGFTFAANFTYASRRKLESGRTLTINHVGAFSGRDDNPVVIYSSAHPEDPAKALVVVVTISQFDIDFVKLSETELSSDSEAPKNPAP